MKSETKKKRRKRKKANPKAQRLLTYSGFGLIGLVVVALLATILILVNPFKGLKEKENRPVSEETVVEKNSEETNQSQDVIEEDRFVITEEERAAALERMASFDSLEQAWENTWLKKIDISSDTANYLTIDECLIMESDSSKVKVSGILSGIPNADSDDLYLFALNTYENSISDGAEPIDTYRIEKTNPRFELYANLNHKQAGTRLFKKFVVAAKKNGKYQILGTSRYVTNPEMLAKVNSYQKTSSVKGLIVDPNKLHGNELDDLGVKQGAYNIPLGYIMGQTSYAGNPTIYYEYGGKTYAFNGQAVAEFDIVFGTLARKGIQATAVILNNSGAYSELIHPKARGLGSQSGYYMFNGSDADGVNAMAAAVTFLAERYSGGHGLISNWVIANEINATKEWNTYASTDHYTYTEEYAKGFRVMYNAIKSVNGAAKIYMPLDQRWNRNRDDGDYDGRDILDDFNSIIKAKGNIDWDLSVHPYPVPLTDANFWNGGWNAKYTSQSVDTPMLNMKNINVVTDYLSGANFRRDDGSTRQVFLSEVGFTSTSGENVQAAAIAYAYYIAEKNPMINGLIINREVDSAVEIAQGLAVGLSHTDGTHKKAYEVYKHLDMADSQEYSKFALDVIGADSWASIVRYW